MFTCEAGAVKGSGPSVVEGRPSRASTLPAIGNVSCVLSLAYSTSPPRPLRAVGPPLNTSETLHYAYVQEKGTSTLGHENSSRELTDLAIPLF